MRNDSGLTLMTSTITDLDGEGHNGSSGVLVRRRRSMTDGEPSPLSDRCSSAADRVVVDRANLE